MGIQILSLNDEIKADMRNYAMVAGFSILMIWAVICAVYLKKGIVFDPGYMTMVLLPVMATLLVLGVVLAILGKRDLTAILFITLAFSGLVTALSGGQASTVPIDIALLLFGIVVLFTGDEQKWAIALFMILNGAFSVAGMFSNVTVCIALLAIMGFIDFYIALAIVCERFKLPFRDVFVTDDVCPENDGVPVDFKKSSSVIGFLLLLSTNLSFMMAYLIPSDFSLVVAEANCASLGLCMVIAGLIMLCVAGMRFTPFFFVMIGIGYFLEGSLPEPGLAIGMIYLALALFTLVRKDKRILVSLLIFLTGVIVIVNNLTGFSYPEVALVFECVLSVISLYLVAALTLDGKLKLI